MSSALQVVLYHLSHKVGFKFFSGSFFFSLQINVCPNDLLLISYSMGHSWEKSKVLSSSIALGACKKVWLTFRGRN